MNSPINNEILRNWFFDNVGTYRLPFDDVVTIGSGPFEEQDFDNFLGQFGFNLHDPEEEIEIVIVGNKDWDQQKIQDILKFRSGKTLKVYSQEMFISYMLTGVDPFDCNQEILDEFAENHSALEFLISWGFNWPSTQVRIWSGNEELITDWPEKGLLGSLNYKVGLTGLPTNKRRRILTHAFVENAPMDLPDSYTKDWGAPESQQRLKKMANSIATFCRNAKLRNSQNLENAIHDWEADLNWLHKKYYEPRGFRFNWPDTTV